VGKAGFSTAQDHPRTDNPCPARNDSG